MRILPAALFLVFAAASAGEASEIAPGAVLRGDALFLMSPEGHLSAHDAATGARRWSSGAAARPLAVDRARVLAQAASPPGQLRLVILDAASGRLLAESSVELPPGVSAPIDETGDTRFRVQVEAAGPQARLSWTWESRPMRGALLEGEDDGARQAQGAVDVDLSTARFALAAPRPAAGLAPLPLVLAREADAGAFRQRPQQVGGFYVATQAAPAGLVLKRWTEDAIPLPDVALPAEAILQLGAADGRHLLVSREAVGAPPEQAHEWTVIALESGAPVAGFRTSTAAAPFAVAGSRVLVAHQPWEQRAAAGWQRHPRRIEAHGRESGALDWWQEIRDTSYRGPVAP